MTAHCGAWSMCCAGRSVSLDVFGYSNSSWSVGSDWRLLPCMPVLHKRPHPGVPRGGTGEGQLPRSVRYIPAHTSRGPEYPQLLPSRRPRERHQLLRRHRERVSPWHRGRDIELRVLLQRGVPAVRDATRRLVVHGRRPVCERRLRLGKRLVDIDRN